MKRIALLALMAPTAALAHPGDHGGFSVQGVLNHLVTQPDHAVIIAAAFGVGLYVLYRVRARK